MSFYLVGLIVLQAITICTPASLPQRALENEQLRTSCCGCQSLCPNLPNYNPSCCNTNPDKCKPKDYCKMPVNCEEKIACSENCNHKDCDNQEQPDCSKKVVCSESCEKSCNNVVSCEKTCATISYEGTQCFTSRFKDTCSSIESVVSDKVNKIICFARGLMKKLNLAMDVRVNLGTDCEPQIAVRLTHPLCLQLNKNCKLYVERPDSGYGEGYSK